MKLESQVVSLELAKKMKELGAPQESYFYWKTDEDSKSYIVNHNSRYMHSKGVIEANAYTVAELGEMLPESIYREKTASNRSFSSVKTSENKWYVEYYDLSFTEDTEADARAKMWIYLKENNLI